MRVKLFAYYRDYAGCKAFDMPAPSTLFGVLEYCCERWPQFRQKLVSQDGTDVGQDVIPMVNGRNIEYLQGKDTPLCDDDVVSLFPVVAGG